MTTVKEIREKSGLSRVEFSERYGIPVRSMENWESGARKCPPYLIRLLDEAVTKDEKTICTKCYSKEILQEIGYCYRELLKILNDTGKNPYQVAETFPTKYFTMLYVQTAGRKIPEKLNERIAQLMDLVDPEDWAASMNIPCPMKYRQYFMMALMEYTE